MTKLNKVEGSIPITAKYSNREKALSEPAEISVTNDFIACFETNNFCSLYLWHRQRRTHVLSNGEVIWDMSGNAWEWVKDENKNFYGPKAYMSQITKNSHYVASKLEGGRTCTARRAKEQFGPSGDYTNLNASPYGGLGRGGLNKRVGAVYRGSYWGSSTQAGIFSVSLDIPGHHRYGVMGFRCVYVPGISIPTVSIDTYAPTEINISNASTFTLFGECSEEGEEVVVDVSGVKGTTACLQNNWIITLDVTRLNSRLISIKVDHVSPIGWNARQLVKSIQNNFICPDNFVVVPALKGYTIYDFCVAKYEMKKDGANRAVSRPNGTPYINVNRKTTKNRCTSKGPGYDLITNDQWQTS